MATTSPATNRIVTLDTIRGIAVMGIFSVNIIAFAMIEEAYFNPGAYGGSSGPSLYLWAANMILVDGKMRSLFSMLFGASMMLVIERAEASGQRGWLVHVRRMLVLLGFGLIHYFFIWFGDILTLYAVCGLFAALFRRYSNRTLVIVGAVLLAVHMLIFGSFSFLMYQADIAAHAPSATQAAIKKWNDGFGAFYPTAAQLAENSALHLGSWTSFAAHNLRNWGNLIPMTVLWMPDTVGLMLIGMAGYRSGFLTGDWAEATYRRVASIFIPIGLAAGATVVAYDISSHFYSVGLFTAFVVLDTPFITLMAVGYAALIILLSRGQGWLAQRIAAAGRCAFTNYLGTSLIATFVFYGWGLGYYGSALRWQAWLLVPIVWTAMLSWSKPWLEHFHYGPFEWAWRSIARGKLQPMRKARAEPLAA